jgi:hypothetical protein
MPYCHEWDEAKKIPSHLYEKAGKFGLLSCIVGTPAPVEYLPCKELPGGVDPTKYDSFHEFIVCDEM